MANNKFGLVKLLCILIALLLCGSAVFFFMGLEGETPQFQLESPVHNIGPSYTLKGWATDQKSGLRRVWIAIFQKGKEKIIFDQTFPAGGFLRGRAVQKQPVSVEINIKTMGLSDGEALLRTAVWDHSYRGWGTGNQGYSEHKILIDTRPATIDVLTRSHNLNQGGAGLAIYRVSEPGTVNGVQVADNFFPGYAGYFTDPNTYIAFFAVSHKQKTGSQLYVSATDRAGNVCRTGFAYYINTKNFKQDNINISDGFLRQNIPQFENALNMENPSASLLDKFLVVNRDLRRASNIIVENVCKKSEPKKYWDGPFLRLPNSARKAGFADHRKYRYNGKTIDEQVHLGIDLAATAHAPVPAANNGRVALAESVNIYGKAVILDHGFGLFSMYGHLSRIDVAKNQVVSKGDVIGFTGSTGLAGGDHLHYSMIVGQTFVNPIEWWDPNWIRHNVTDKLKAIK